MQGLKIFSIKPTCQNFCNSLSYTPSDSETFSPYIANLYCMTLIFYRKEIMIHIYRAVVFKIFDLLPIRKEQTFDHASPNKSFPKIKSFHTFLLYPNALGTSELTMDRRPLKKICLEYKKKRDLSGEKA